MKSSHDLSIIYFGAGRNMQFYARNIAWKKSTRGKKYLRCEIRRESQLQWWGSFLDEINRFNVAQFLFLVLPDVDGNRRNFHHSQQLKGELIGKPPVDERWITRDVLANYEFAVIQTKLIHFRIDASCKSNSRKNPFLSSSPRWAQRTWVKNYMFIKRISRWRESKFIFVPQIFSFFLW